MIATEWLIPFIFASALLSLAPGPDNLFVLSQSALHGRRTGLWVTAGLCSGLVFHTTAVALGVAAILQTSEWAFNALKCVGVGYLLYLAWHSFRASVQPVANNGDQSKTAWQLFARGVVMNVTNPKVSIFFLAFLPQFTSPEAGSLAAQVFVLGAIFMLIAFALFSMIAMTAGALGNWLQHSPKAQVVLNRMAGLVFVALAINLLFTSM